MECREGYESNMLSSNAKYVLGIFIGEGTIRHTSDKYVNKNLEFKKMFRYSYSYRKKRKM